MLYDETAVKANIRNREGKRVFYLGETDRLTPSARDWLTAQRIPILPGHTARVTRYQLLGGGFCEEKPEHMTHLNGDVLVPEIEGLAHALLEYADAIKAGDEARLTTLLAEGSAINDDIKKD